MMATTSRVACAALLAMLLAAPALAAGPDFDGMQVEQLPGKPAPSFALPGLDGKTVRLEDFRGKVVMMVFWATW
jgi:hypothetical protein